jgi:hypothetical protein
VKKGCEFIERTPMNWGKNLTLLGAMRLTHWVLLSTMFASTNKERFVDWLAKKLLPKLKKDDVLVLDNLSAHHDERVVPLCAARGVRVVYLSPYSHDFNPIEPGGACRSNRSVGLLQETPFPFAASLGVPAFALHLGIVASGSRILVTRCNPMFNSGDHWG